MRNEDFMIKEMAVSVFPDYYEDFVGGLFFSGLDVESLYILYGVNCALYIEHKITESQYIDNKNFINDQILEIKGKQIPVQEDDKAERILEILPDDYRDVVEHILMNFKNRPEHSAGSIRSFSYAMFLEKKISNSELCEILEIVRRLEFKNKYLKNV